MGNYEGFSLTFLDVSDALGAYALSLALERRLHLPVSAGNLTMQASLLLSVMNLPSVHRTKLPYFVPALARGYFNKDSNNTDVFASGESRHCKDSGVSSADG